jgi:hypothetical protein
MANKSNKPFKISNISLPKTCIPKTCIPKTIIEIIIKNRINELLTIISNKYPKKFKKEFIDDEIENIINKIKYVEQLEKVEQTKLENQIQNINKAVDKKIKINKTRRINPQEERCHARIWNSIYDKSTNKEVIDIDKKFKITDFNELKIKEFVARYTIGRQCTRKKRDGKEYCFQHIKHNPHGDYFKNPPNELCFHYMKDGNYL